MKRIALLLPVLAAALLWSCAGEQPEVQEVNIYTHRHYEADQRLYDRFQETTGIQVNVIQAGADELIKRIELEGENSPADLLVTVDAGRLHRAKELGLLQPVQSDVLRDNIPAHLRDRDDHWFGLTQRARIVVYAKDRVQPDQLSTYEALTDPIWKGRILVRSSANIYNQSLLASIIAAHGPEAAREWAAGIVANLARTPKGSDRDQVKAIAAGEGDIALINTYYLGLLLTDEDPEARSAGEQVEPFFPNQDGRGAHVNVSGAGVAAHAPHRENAVQLLEFLSGEEAQREFAAANFEYPVKPGVPWSELLQSWGRFKADSVDLSRLGELNAEAVRIFDEVGWR